MCQRYKVINNSQYALPTFNNVIQIESLRVVNPGQHYTEHNGTGEYRDEKDSGSCLQVGYDPGGWKDTCLS